jgi:hypothetical protein
MFLAHPIFFIVNLNTMPLIIINRTIDLFLFFFFFFFFLIVRLMNHQSYDHLQPISGQSQYMIASENRVDWSYFDLTISKSSDPVWLGFTGEGVERECGGNSRTWVHKMRESVNRPDSEGSSSEYRVYFRSKMEWLKEIFQDCKARV